MFFMLANSAVSAMNQYQEESFVINLANIIHRQRDSVDRDRIVAFINDHKTDSPFVHDTMTSYGLKVNSIHLVPQENQLTLMMANAQGMKFQYIVTGNRYTKSTMNFICITDVV